MDQRPVESHHFTQLLSNEEMFYLSNDAVLILDEAGYIQKANEQASQLFGYFRNELFGKPVFELYPEEFYQESLERFREIKASKFSRFDITAKRKDGQNREIEVSANHIKKQGNPLIFFIIRDFTEQNKALKKIDQLSQFPEQNPFPVLRTNSDYQLEYANQASRELLETLGIELGDYLPVDWCEHVDTICQNQDCNNQKPNFEAQVRHRYYLFSVSFINQTCQVYLYGQDITDLKHYQEELKEANGELNTFIYKTHHDLKNPLSSLLGLIHVAETDITDETALTYLSMIHQSASNLDSILNSLIKAIEIKDGKHHSADFAIDELIEAVFEKVKLLDGAEQVNLDYQIAEGLSTFRSDWDALFYVLDNLVSNAVKYRDESKQSPQIQVSVYIEQGYVVIKVEDNGVGIPKGSQEQVFDIFFRANKNRKGTGLGLYIVNKGVKKIGGTVEVESQEGEGTAFNIYIPEDELIKIEGPFE